MAKHAYSKVDIEAVRILQESAFEVGITGDGGFSITRSSIHDEMVFYIVLMKYIRKLEGMDSPPALFGKRFGNGPYLLTKDCVELKKIVNLATKVHKHQDFYKLHPKLAFLCDFVVDYNFAAMIDDAGVSSSMQVNLYLKYKELLSGLKSSSLDWKCYSFMEGPKKNARSLRSYTDALFKRYARLLVVRVDLLYKQKYGDSISFEEAIKHKDELLYSRRKNALAKSWVGFAYRLEYGPESRWHYHLVVFLNGAKFCADTYHASLIIEEWNRITANRGRGHNCNMKAGTGGYRFCGIGMVNQSDTEKRAIMNKALSYLTKSDTLAQLRVKGRRTFNKGRITKKMTNRGRPRTRGSACRSPASVPHYGGLLLVGEPLPLLHGGRGEVGQHVGNEWGESAYG